MYNQVRPISFHGRSLEALRALPTAARRNLGHQLDRVQRGLEPIDWKPMPSVGKSVRELRVRSRGQYRVIYLAQAGSGVHVLHAFQKKSRRTRLRDIRIARAALNELEI